MKISECVEALKFMKSEMTPREKRKLKLNIMSFFLEVSGAVIIGVFVNWWTVLGISLFAWGYAVQIKLSMITNLETILKTLRK